LLKPPNWMRLPPLRQSLLPRCSAYCPVASSNHSLSTWYLDSVTVQILTHQQVPQECSSASPAGTIRLRLSLVGDATQTKKIYMMARQWWTVFDIKNDISYSPLNLPPKLSAKCVDVLSWYWHLPRFQTSNSYWMTIYNGKPSLIEFCKPFVVPSGTHGILVWPYFTNQAVVPCLYMKSNPRCWIN